MSRIAQVRRSYANREHRFYQEQLRQKAERLKSSYNYHIPAWFFKTEKPLPLKALVTQTILAQRDEYLRKYRGLDNYHRINCGFCFHFALRLKEKIPQLTIVDGEDAHSLVRLGRVFFDAEIPEGTTDIHKVPFFKRYASSDKIHDSKDPFKPHRNSWRAPNSLLASDDELHNGSCYYWGETPPENPKLWHQTFG